MITTAQAQPFGGPSGCCWTRKEENPVTGWIVLGVVFVVVGLMAWDRLTQSWMTTTVGGILQ